MHAYLEALKNKPKTENTEVLQFCHNYSEISKKPPEKGKLDKYIQFKWFFQGLLSFIQSKLINQYDIDFDIDALFDIAQILKKTYRLIEIQKKITELSITDNKNDCISDLVDR